MASKSRRGVTEPLVPELEQHQHRGPREEPPETSLSCCGRPDVRSRWRELPAAPRRPKRRSPRRSGKGSAWRKGWLSDHVEGRRTPGRRPGTPTEQRCRTCARCTTRRAAANGRFGGGAAPGRSRRASTTARTATTAPATGTAGASGHLRDEAGEGPGEQDPEQQAAHRRPTTRPRSCSGASDSGEGPMIWAAIERRCPIPHVWPVQHRGVGCERRRGQGGRPPPPAASAPAAVGPGCRRAAPAARAEPVADLGGGHHERGASRAAVQVAGDLREEGLGVVEVGRRHVAGPAKSAAGPAASQWISLAWITMTATDSALGDIDRVGDGHRARRRRPAAERAVWTGS